jgi:hypothetical protein
MEKKRTNTLLENREEREKGKKTGKEEIQRVLVQKEERERQISVQSF